MLTIKGTVKNGQISTSEPIAWPEGTEVSVRPMSDSSEFEHAQFDDQAHQNGLANDPESITRWIEEFDAIPALQMTPAEEAQWQAARSAQRALDAAQCAGQIWNARE